MREKNIQKNLRNQRYFNKLSSDDISWCWKRYILGCRWHSHLCFSNYCTVKQRWTSKSDWVCQQSTYPSRAQVLTTEKKAFIHPCLRAPAYPAPANSRCKTLSKILPRTSRESPLYEITLLGLNLLPVNSSVINLAIPKVKMPSKASPAV